MTYVGYQPLTFESVNMQSGKNKTLNGVIQESTTSLTEVTVTGVKQTGTEVALMQDLKKSEVVVSGMSNDQIVKSLDRDAAEVVKRIPGVTVQSNNFIVIRGLAERYNTVLLNDALTPSAEVDIRSFSSDILPSSVFDRVLIFKSGSPELPGEFGGGVVKVYTKNSVLENTTTATVSGWYRSGTTFNDYLASARSGTDVLGSDDGKQQLPSGGTPNEIAPKLQNKYLFKINHLILGREFAIELMSDAVEDVPDGGLEGLEVGVGFGAQPFVLCFAPQGLDFVEVGAVGRQVEDVNVLVLPSLQTGAERGRVVNRGVVEDQNRGPDAGGGPGIDGLDDESRVHRSFAGVGTQVVGKQVVGGGVVEAQHVEARAVAGPGGDVFAGKLPAVGDGRGEAKARFVAGVHVQVPLFLQRVQFGEFGGLFGGLFGGCFRVLGPFQAVAEAPPFGPMLFKKRFSVRGEKSLASS